MKIYRSSIYVEKLFWTGSFCRGINSSYKLNSYSSSIIFSLFVVFRICATDMGSNTFVCILKYLNTFFKVFVFDV